MGKNRHVRTVSVVSSLALLLAAGSSALAQPVRAPNGHFYEVVSSTDITWNDAKTAAEATLRCGQPGHLVTITSQEEQDFLVATFGDELTPKWMGAHQPVSSDGATGWTWITGEAWSFTQWNAGEPNNGNYGSPYGFEDAGVFWTDGNWNDSPSLWNNYGTTGGYVIEWDVDLTVIIAGCDTGVPNVIVDPSGPCFISDEIAECASGASNHGDFVSCVAHLTNSLKRDGVITGAQKGRIQSCAAQAAIP